MFCQLPPPPPPDGVGGCNSSAAGRSSRLVPRHSTSPFPGVAGEPAGQARRHLLNSPPLPPTSLASPMWASMVRGGVATCVGETACPSPPTSVSAADFSAFYDRCMQSGLKARMAFNHAAYVQTVTVMCILPATNTPTASAGRRCRRRCRKRRSRAATATAACESQVPPQPQQDAATPACETTPLLSTATPPPTSPPEIEPPPAMRVRKRRNEAELLREPEEEGELLLHPPRRSDYGDFAGYADTVHAAITDAAGDTRLLYTPRC